jgi:hypothetical protein
MLNLSIILLVLSLNEQNYFIFTRYSTLMG